ncbi:hypothetical protein [Thalassospira lucentensis]|uniref:hypothetical protein n=1 Tax=Thalassospira lucentensis TaxID=168935 RepID=UPI0029431DD6|nr:hypothetical protein [Thalassospira lucentensis]WOI11812.1 hypothetical protein R1T41_04340 [Thalassospira lucentensis]
MGKRYLLKDPIYNSIFIILSISTVMFFLFVEIEPKTDSLWLHFISYQFFAPDRVKLLGLDQWQSGSYEALELLRREAMRFNYPMHIVSGWVGVLIAEGNRPLALGLGLGIPAVLGVIVAAIYAIKAGVSEVLMVASAYFALTSLMPGPMATDHLLYYGDVRDFLNLGVLLLDPGPAFSPLSTQPKSTVLLLFMVALSVRWKGNNRLAMIICLSGAFWHITYTIVLIGLMAVLVVSNRFIFKSREYTVDAMIFSAICISSAILCFVVYILFRGDMIWGEFSLFIQLTTRMLLLAEVTLVVFVAHFAVSWLVVKLGADRQFIYCCLSGVLMFVSVYSAVGQGWERVRYFEERFSSSTYVAQYGTLAEYYSRALDYLEKNSVEK